VTGPGIAPRRINPNGPLGPQESDPERAPPTSQCECSNPPDTKHSHCALAQCIEIDVPVEVNGRTAIGEPVTGYALVPACAVQCLGTGGIGTSDKIVVDLYAPEVRPEYSVEGRSYDITYSLTGDHRSKVRVTKDGVQTAELVADSTGDQLVGTLVGEPAVFASDRSAQVLPFPVDAHTIWLLEWNPFRLVAPPSRVETGASTITVERIEEALDWPDAHLLSLVDDQYSDRIVEH